MRRAAQFVIGFCQGAAIACAVGTVVTVVLVAVTRDDTKVFPEWAAWLCGIAAALFLLLAVGLDLAVGPRRKAAP